MGRCLRILGLVRNLPVADLSDDRAEGRRRPLLRRDAMWFRAKPGRTASRSGLSPRCNASRVCTCRQNAQPFSYECGSSAARCARAPARLRSLLEHLTDERQQALVRGGASLLRFTRSRSLTRPTKPRHPATTGRRSPPRNRAPPHLLGLVRDSAPGPRSPVTIKPRSTDDLVDERSFGVRRGSPVRDAVEYPTCSSGFSFSG